MPFSPPLLILAFQPILFHTVVTEEFFNKNRAELFECGVANDMSKVTHVGVHHINTMFLFCSVHFALTTWIIKNYFCLALPETGVTFLHEDYSIHQFS